MAGGRDRLSDQDRQLWRLVTRDIDALRKPAAAPAPPVAPSDKPVVAKASRAAPAGDNMDAELARLASQGVGAARVRPMAEAARARLADAAAGGFTAAGLDRRTAQKLARGRIAIDATLDLHGRRQHEAHAALTGFIARAHRGGLRCVLIITGKGQRQYAGQGDDGRSQPGILRRRLGEWLSAEPWAGMVLSIMPARPEHGGDGAFYVLLRRQR